jgi:hypothetical protein
MDVTPWLRRGAHWLQEAMSEPRILFYAYLASFLYFVAALPMARHQVPFVHAENPLVTVLAAQFFAAMFVLPLMLYALSALARLTCAMFRGHGTFQRARLSLFWAVLVVMPVLMASSLAAFAGMNARFLALFVAAAFAWVWGNGLAESEEFTRSWPAVVVIGAMPVALFFSLAGLNP